MIQIVLIGWAMVLGEVCPEGPTINLVGGSFVQVNCQPYTNTEGEPVYTELGAVAYTPCAPSLPDGNLTDQIKVEVRYDREDIDWNDMEDVDKVDVHRPGYYKERFTVEDFSEPPQMAEAIKTVRVWDIVDLQLRGDTDINWECNIPYEDAGATAISSCHGDLTDQIRTLGMEQMIAVNVGETYTITLQLVHPDDDAVVLEKKRYITIVDTVEPSINLKGLGEDKQIETIRGYDDPEDNYYYGYQPLWYNGYIYPGWDPEDYENSPVPPYWRFFPIPDEKFFTETYEERYGSDPPVDMAETWNIRENDAVYSRDGVVKEYYPWHCDIQYQDPGVSVYDDCEGNLDPDDVIIILTRYLEEVWHPWYWWGYDWWYEYWWIWRYRPWWADWWYAWRPVHREVFQYVGTLADLRDKPNDPGFEVPLLKEPGIEEGNFYVDDELGFRKYRLKWGGYRAYYFIKDHSGNPQKPAVLRTLRSRYIIPDYSFSITGAGPVVKECGAKKINLLLDVELSDKCVGDLTPSITVTGDYDPNVPGTYPIYYDGYNIYGQSYRTQRMITVVDNEPPVLDLYDQMGNIVRPEPGRTLVNDYIPWCVWRDGIRYGDGTTEGKIGWDWWNNWYVILPYIGFKANDACGGLDCTPSVLMTGESKLREALEFMDEASSHLEHDNPEDWDLRPYVDPGRYSLWFTYKDSVLNQSGTNRVVNVIQSEPEIDFGTAPNPMVSECGEPVSFPEPTIWDKAKHPKADIEWQCSTDPADIYVETKLDVIDTFQPGTYEAVYFVKNALWKTDTATFTVEVKDTLPPVITLSSAEMNWETGVPFNYQDFVTVQDQCSGVLMPELLNKDGMDFASPQTGTYIFAISATDEAGNASTATLIVHVKSPYPELFPKGENPMTLECGSPFVDPGCEAKDPDGNDLTGTIVSAGTVNPDLPGSYSITYNVVSGQGVAAKPVTRTVIVVDTISPELTLNGLDKIDIEIGETFKDPGAVARDACGDVNLTESIERSGELNTSLMGMYTLTYRVTDDSGNSAIAKRLVRVGTNEEPVLTVIGANPMQVECGTVFTDPGAKAMDKEDGDLTNVIEVASNTVNAQVPGSYSILYTVKDSQGNVAVPLARAVNVADTEAPVISLLGENPLKIEYGQKYVEAGATAADACDGDVSTAVVLAGDTVDTNKIGRYTVRYSVVDYSANESTASRQVEVVPVAVVVPNLADMTMAEAQEKLALLQLRTGSVTSQYHDTVAEGHVISQSPMPGSGIPSGSVVMVTISKGPQGAVIEGEAPPEGEVSEGEGEEEPVPGCECLQRKKSPATLNRILGDYLFFGLVSLTLIGAVSWRKFM